MKRFIITALFVIGMTFSALAQDKIPVTDQDYQNTRVEMADGFYQEGKIYVLVAIILSVVLGLVGYTVWVDQKVSKLEKEIGNK
jgi:hypothetical protein